MITGEAFELPLRLEQLSELKWEDFRAFIEQLFKTSSVEMFVYGNVKPSEAKDLMSLAKKVLSPTSTIEACSESCTAIRLGE